MTELGMLMSLKRSTCGLHAVWGSVRAGVRIRGLEPVGGQFLCSALFWAGGQTRTRGFQGGLSSSHHATPVQEAHIICNQWGELGAWGHGGWGRVGAGAGAGAVVWESWGAIHHEPWSTVAARPLAPFALWAA